jgi:hypothetical protein
MYHNAREAQRAAELDLRQAAGDVLDWDPQVRQPLVVNGVKIGNYIADFSVTYSNGSEQLVDVKGAPPTQVFKLKAILVAALYPDCAIKVIQ